jgi:hypothetical protein
MENDYSKILKQKIAYYGDTEAAREFAAEEYANFYARIALDKYREKLLVVEKRYFMFALKFVLSDREVKDHGTYFVTSNCFPSLKDISTFVCKTMGFDFSNILNIYVLSFNELKKQDFDAFLNGLENDVLVIEL